MKELKNSNLVIEALILSLSMITPGSSFPYSASPQEVAWQTIKTLYKTIDLSVPGICFLSGNQTQKSYLSNLNALNQFKGFSKPGTLTFAYGRGIEETVVDIWGGKEENVGAA